MTLETKLKIARELLCDRIVDRDSFKASLDTLEETFIGKALEQKTKDFTKYVQEEEIMVEALTKYIKKLIDLPGEVINELSEHGGELEGEPDLDLLEEQEAEAEAERSELEEEVLNNEPEPTGL
jgi:peptidoglycan hydrolase CwlO-like protein